MFFGKPFISIEKHRRNEFFTNFGDAFKIKVNLEFQSAEDQIIQFFEMNAISEFTKLQIGERNFAAAFLSKTIQFYFPKCLIT